ncbi:hypothetical protein OROGR_018173 [Orobanche gracilis]
MKFMKLGSKPDQFQTDGENIRYVASELATDMVVSIGDIKFYVHKFPLLSKSSRLQKLVSTTGDTHTTDQINIHDIPGGPAAFEICAKFCYGMVATLNAYNVVATRCAAEYLEMYETVEKGNLIYKIDIFLAASIFKSWKDSIIVLQTTKCFPSWSEESKIVSHCLDSIAGRALTVPSKVDWSYTCNREKKLLSENGLEKQLTVPEDRWVEDLCELQIDLYKRVIMMIRAKGKITEGVIGESLKAYALKRVPFFSGGSMQGNDITGASYLVDTIISLLPTEKSCVPCFFLLKLLQASMILECEEIGKRELMRKIAGQLEEASVGDLLMAACDIDVVHELVERFVMGEHSAETDGGGDDDGELRYACPGYNSDASKAMVARLVDGYMAEAARDSSLPLSKFVGLAETVSGFPRSTHDGVYRAIDMYLKEHPSLTKSEKKRLCRLMDCKKLSPEACAHAVQNERLPLRAVVQVIFFEQARSAHDHPGAYGSSRSATTRNSDEDWDGAHTSGELKDAKLNDDRVTPKKVKKMFSRLWSSKDIRGETSSSDSSESPASTSGEIKEAVKVHGQMTINQMQKKVLSMK